MTKFKSEITFPQAGFLKWALEQPEERTIDHTRSWSACAVGDFFRASGGTLTYDYDIYDHPAGFPSWSEYAEHILPRRLNGTLNNSGRIPHSVRGLDTYGDLQDYIRRHYVENDDESESS